MDMKNRARYALCASVALGGTGCAASAPTQQPAPAVLVTATPDTVVARETSDGVFFHVTKRVVNAGDETVFYETCPTANLQRLVDGTWRDAQGQVCSLMLRPPRSLAPGARLDFDHRFGGSGDAPPAFPWANDVAGTYRLTFLVRRDSSLTGGDYHEAVSNPFVVRLP